MPQDPPLPPLFDRAHALAAGITAHQIAHRVRTGAWYALRRNQYVVAETFDQLSARDQQLLRIVAALRLRGSADIASHISAALAWDWPLPLAGAGPVTVTSSDLRRSAWRRDRMIVQVATLPDYDVRTRSVTVAGLAYDLRLTSRPRTLADNLRHADLADSVAMGDAVLRSGQVTWEQVRAVLDRQEPWPYLARGRRALTLLDPRRESWLESFSFVRTWQHGCPMPEPQVSVYDRRGRFVARVDGWLDDEAVALEADGQAKYLQAVDGTPADVDLAASDIVHRVQSTMRAQQERELRLRELGVAVVRWGTAEIARRPEQVATRIEAARARPRPEAFQGSVTRLPAPPWLSRPRPPGFRHSNRFSGRRSRAEWRKRG